MPESVKRRGSSGPTTGAMLGLWSGVVATGREGYGRAVQLLLAMVLLMWALEVVDTALDNQLDQGGIIPREAEGLDGVIAAPFLHVGFGHLIANTLPFVAMGLVIGLEGPLRLLGVTAIVAVISGLGTWLIAPADTIHLGASGVVFGYATYLLARGLFNRRPVEIAIGAVVAVLWGGALMAGLEPRQGISWQGPLFGASGGETRAAPWVRVSASPLSLEELAARVRHSGAGAVVTFSGVTREVERLEYDAYVQMAGERMTAIATEAVERHGLCAAAVEHRVGEVPLTAPSVIVAVSAPHRGEAFAGG